MLHCIHEDGGRGHEPRNVALEVGKARKLNLPGVSGGSMAPLITWFCHGETDFGFLVSRQ